MSTELGACQTTPRSTSENNELFSEFQTVVHLSEDLKSNHLFVVMGASGDLAKKKIYPTLWWLYRDNLLPTKTFFLGYARSSLEIGDFLSKSCYPYMKVLPGEEEKFQEFVKLNYYLSGSYDKQESFEALNTKISEIAKEHTVNKNTDCNRIFYLALPPSVYSSVTRLLSHSCKAQKYILRFFFN